MGNEKGEHLVFCGNVRSGWLQETSFNVGFEASLDGGEGRSDNESWEFVGREGVGWKIEVL